jgi:hypothetical protein
MAYCYFAVNVSGDGALSIVTPDEGTVDLHMGTSKWFSAIGDYTIQVTAGSEIIQFLAVTLCGSGVGANLKMTVLKDIGMLAFVDIVPKIQPS